MKNIVMCCAVAGLWASVHSVSGQVSTFTYQGQLKRAGSPMTESADMRFLLFDDESAESPIAGPLLFDGTTSSPVLVQNGLFTVELDFGGGAFQQGGRWLEIQVRSPHDPSDAGAYTTLTPRQRITAAPFAMSVPGLAATEAGVEVEGNIHTTGEMTASAFSSNSPLIFKVNPANVECARFDDANCYLGLGTDAPGARLHVGGTAGVDGIMFPDGTLQTTAAGNVVGGDSVWSQVAGGNIFYTGGNVGVGSSAPSHRLAIAGGPLWTSNSWRGALELDNAAAIGWKSNTAGRRFGIGQTNTGLYFFHTASDPGTTGSPAVYDMFINDAGNVNIGSGATPSNTKLNIAAAGDGAELLRFDTERPWILRQVRTGPTAGLQLLSTVGQKAFEITANDGSNVATFLADSGASRVGIGTITPTSKLDIVGQDGLRISGFQPFLTLTDANAGNARARIANANGSFNFFTEGAFATGIPTMFIDGFTASLSCADFKMGHPTRRGSPGRALVDNGTHLVINFANDWGYTYVNGRLKTNVLEVLGADLAEKFPSTDENVEPGTVMEIDPQNPGKLRVAREAYSTRVAGVVSGAGDLPVGAVLGNLPGHDDAPPIALSGRVWVRCDAHHAAIEPGDLLTTSDFPGYAMRAGERDRSHGALLGKAMTALPQGERGLVLVLVNLH